jgi:hypothetical protein
MGLWNFFLIVKYNFGLDVCNFIQVSIHRNYVQDLYLYLFELHFISLHFEIQN